MDDTIVELLRAELNHADTVLAQVSHSTGVDPRSLSRFRRGLTLLRLDKAVILVDFFGIRCYGNKKEIGQWNDC